MSTEHSYALQQTLYSLYREYYHSGKVVLCRNDDFANGTLRIREPGLYVITEDIIFNPNEEMLKTEEYENGAYNMGFFAAIAIETKGVIIDLQGNTIRQSFSHYFRQRFFNIIQLGSTPFIPGQGPGPVKTDSFEAAVGCLILNGTLGLSSHGGIHGNNNEDIFIQNMKIVDFETTGIQLNGVHNAFIEDVKIRGIHIAPLASETFGLLQHIKLLEPLKGNEAPQVSQNIKESFEHFETKWDVSLILKELTSVKDMLHKPFKHHDMHHDKRVTVDHALENIWQTLCLDTAQHMEKADVWCDPRRYVNKYPIGIKSDAIINTVKATLGNTAENSEDKPFPDGSAMYGIIINCTGIAVNNIRDVCGTNGRGCCAAQHSEAQEPQSKQDYDGPSLHRKSQHVTIQDVTIDRLQLNAHESLGVKIDDKTILRNATGAVVDLATCIPGDCFEMACTYVNLSKSSKSWTQEIIEFMLLPLEGDMQARYESLIKALPHLQFLYNIDIMAHVSKGIFGMRLENTEGLIVEEAHITNLLNSSQVVDPRYIPEGGLPFSISEKQIVSAIDNPLDQNSLHAYGGSDVRGIFVGQVEGSLMSKVNINDCHADKGLMRLIELDESSRCGVSAIEASEISGLVTHMIYVNLSSKLIHLRDIHADNIEMNGFYTYLNKMRIELTDAEFETTKNTSESKEDKVNIAKQKVSQAQIATRSLFRLPSGDPSIIAYELPCQIGDLRL